MSVSPLPGSGVVDMQLGRESTKLEADICRIQAHACNADEDACQEIGLLAAVILAACKPSLETCGLVGLEVLAAETLPVAAGLASVLGISTLTELAKTCNVVSKILPAKALNDIAATFADPPRSPSPARKEATKIPAIYSRDVYSVTEPISTDAQNLAKLYRFDYVGAHMDIYRDQAGLKDAGFDDWETALGTVNFGNVIADISSVSVKPKTGKKTKANSKGRAEPIVGLLQCVGKKQRMPIVGYILYELREKGSAKNRQQYCEIVNIAVCAEHRGAGIGRLLFEDLMRCLQSEFPLHAKDIRLYVAEQNAAPRAWYQRLGFKESGWQTEKINDGEVKFVRMMKHN